MVLFTVLEGASDYVSDAPMSEQTGIQWTDATWNPVRGCTKVSPGCAHCYAETFAERFRGVKGHPYEQGFDLRLVPEKLDEPLHWTKPRRVFVNSMSDLFHEGVPYHHISFVWRTMQRTPQHVYQILTKRAQRLYDDIPKLVHHFGVLPNVWLGVSVENQHFADERIPILLETPAAVRFISAEPLLGPIDFTLRGDRVAGWDEDWRYNVLSGEEWAGPRDENPERSQHLDWVIVGGESGADARPCDVAWVRAVITQCQTAGVPVFAKQLGAHIECSREHWPRSTGLFDTDHGNFRKYLCDKKGGDPSEWPADLRIRQFPTGAA